MFAGMDDVDACCRPVAGEAGQGPFKLSSRLTPALSLTKIDIRGTASSLGGSVGIQTRREGRMQSNSTFTCGISTSSYLAVSTSFT